MNIAEKLQTIAENEQKVYDAGYAAGQQAEYDAFWDSFQDNGNEISYSCSFGAAWTDKTFKPKHDINPTDSYMMFRSTGITDLKNLPVKLDFSKSINFQYMMQWARTKQIGVVDVRSSKTALNQTFGYTYYLHTIEKVIFPSSGTTVNIADAFLYAVALENITIEGVIGGNINFQWSPLSRESINSVVAALSDTATGMTATFKQTAVNTAFETSEGTADGSTSEAWLSLVASKPNWTITLA